MLWAILKCTILVCIFHKELSQRKPRGGVALVTPV